MLSCQAGMIGREQISDSIRIVRLESPMAGRIIYNLVTYVTIRKDIALKILIGIC